MATNATCEAGDVCELAPAGIIGRIGKFLMGGFQLYAVYALVTNVSYFTSEAVKSDGRLWMIAGSAWVLVAWCVNLGFKRSWGKRPFWVASAVIAAAIGFDFAVYGNGWGLPLAGVLMALSIYVHGHMGFCHVLAAMLATPGCEMRTISHAKSLIMGTQATLSVCPGIWTPLDNWEVRVRRGRKHESQV